MLSVSCRPPERSSPREDERPLAPSESHRGSDDSDVGACHRGRTMAEATSAEPGSTGGRARTFIRVVIEIVIGAIVVIDALEELSSTRRRISRAFTGWW